MSNPETHPPEIRFHEYLDRELDDIVRAEFERHLATCSACRGELAELEALFTKMESMPEFDLGVDLSAGVIAAIDRSERTPASVRWAAATQVVLAALLVALTWPLLKALSPFTVQRQTIEGIAVGFYAQAVTAWQQFIQATNAAFAEFTQYPLGGVDLEVPFTLLWPLVASATLLWLVGNGLLLRNGERGQINLQRRH